MRQFESIWPETSREDPHVYLDQQIREAALQYDWDQDGIADLYDPEKQQPICSRVRLHEDPLRRLVLLCRARSKDWAGVFKQAVEEVDTKKLGSRRRRHIFSDTPSGARDRDELYEDTVSRLVDPLTLLPVDISELSDEEITLGVANDRIQIEYDCPSASGRVFPEEL